MSVLEGAPVGPARGPGPLWLGPRRSLERRGPTVGRFHPFERLAREPARTPCPQRALAPLLDGNAPKGDHGRCFAEAEPKAEVDRKSTACRLRKQRRATK